jgi:lipid II:glycine glycyltransferase (peptidoglycan interpeptide bridge formation enzyme)
VKVSSINPLDPRFIVFEQFYKDHPDSHFFQSGFFYKFIEGIENYTPLLLIYEDENEKIRGSLLAVIQRENNKFLRYLSSGIIIRGGPLIDHSDNTKAILHDLLAYLIHLTKKQAILIQFRNFSDLQDDSMIFNNLKFKFHEHQNLITETKNENAVWNNLSKSRKRQISKSIKNGASVVEEPTIEEFREFYSILIDLYQKKIHKPLPPWLFFQKFFDQIKNSSLGIIHLIRYKEAIIGGILCPVSKRKMVHEWYVCGLDKEYSTQGIYPSVLATWSAIKYAAKNNFPAFDFMGLGNPKNKYGVRDFKLRFGGILVNYGRFQRINNYPMYAIASIGYYFLKSIFSFISKFS